MIIKNSFIYFSGNVLNKMLPFLVLPILTHYISPEGYGLLSILNIVISILTVFIAISFNGAFIKYCSSQSNLEKDIFLYNATIYSSMNFVIVISVLVMGSFFYKFEFLNIHYNWIYISAIIAFADALMSLILTKFQLDNKPYKYIYLNVSYSILNIGFSLFLIIVFIPSWEGRIIGILLSAIIIILSGVYYLIQYFKFYKIDLHVKTKLYNFGLPLLPHAFSGILIVSIDRIFINSMLDLNSVGIYSTAYQFGIIISIISSSINLAWAPYFFKHFEISQNRISLMKKLLIIFISLLLINFLIIEVSRVIILNFLDIKYHQAIKYIAVISWGHYFEGLYIFVSLFVIYYNKNKYLSYFTVFILAFNSLLNYFLIELYGLYGATLATLYSYIVYFILVSTFSIFFYFVDNKKYLL